jgi:hypothetical protein
LKTAVKQVNIPRDHRRTMPSHPNMSKSYLAEDIEVLTGLEPVKRRPGMYTDTTRPNHLAMEVIDNSVDEALAGHARRIDVVSYEDGSVEVTDDGRGMPVDIHPEQGMPGVELIQLSVRRRFARRRRVGRQRTVQQAGDLDQARRS